MLISIGIDGGGGGGGSFEYTSSSPSPLSSPWLFSSTFSGGGGGIDDDGGNSDSGWSVSDCTRSGSMGGVVFTVEFSVSLLLPELSIGGVA